MYSLMHQPASTPETMPSAGNIMKTIWLPRIVIGVYLAAFLVGLFNAWSHPETIWDMRFFFD